jgi:hypothetical protein
MIGGTRMKIRKNNANNVFVVKFWSKNHYGVAKEKYKCDYNGSVVEVVGDKPSKGKMFHSPSQLLVILEKSYKRTEKNRRKQENHLSPRNQKKFSKKSEEKV